ncbi:MAG TPA: amidohydrolase/deacetylase family metallohydrolase, partial [Chloroflexota bacterium]|nr:amidohydrolase/deacetylase family metallohydrolase [Chloroflexota bacterium]
MNTANHPFDLVITGGRVIDPATGLDGIRDVAVRGGEVAAIESQIPTNGARTLNVAGCMVTPGLVDIHVHVYRGATFWGVDADEIGTKGGTTTMLDAGSTGSQNYRGFKEWVVNPARVRVLGLMNLSEIG